MKKEDRRAFAGWQFDNVKKASKTQKWLSDTNLSVKNIGSFFQVGSTVKHETSSLYQDVKNRKILEAKKSFCKKLKLSLGVKQIMEMSYFKIRALGMAALIKAKKNVCASCGKAVPNLTEGSFRATRLYHHMCAAKDEDQRVKRHKQIRTLLYLHNHKEKRAQVTG